MNHLIVNGKQCFNSTRREFSTRFIASQPKLVFRIEYFSFISKILY